MILILIVKKGCVCKNSVAFMDYGPHTVWAIVAINANFVIYSSYVVCVCCCNAAVPLLCVFL